MLGIYCRISKDRENQKSIKEQTMLGTEFAIDNNLKYEVYVDTGISGGGNISDRPAFNRLIDDIKNDKIKSLYVYNQDRAEREEIIWFTLADLILKKDLDFYENGILVDLNDPNVFFMKGLLSQMNALQRKTTGKRIKDVITRKVNEGEYRGGIYPYGYTVKDSKLVIDDEETQVVLLIYNLSLKKMGFQKIAERLNSMGIQTRYAKIGKGFYKTTNKYTKVTTINSKNNSIWVGGTVGGILKNTIYYGKKKHRDGFTDSPAIMGEDYWKKVQLNIQDNKNNSGKKVQHKYLLKGLMRCGRCGRNYYGRTRENKRDHYYQCSSKRIKTCGNRSINIDKIESFIWERLFIQHEIVERIEQQFDVTTSADKLASLRADRSQKEQRINTLIKSKEKAINLVLNNVLEESEMVGVLKTLNNDISKLQDEIKILDGNISLVVNGHDIVKKYKNKFQLYTTGTNFEERKEIVNDIIKNIIITSNDNYYRIEVEFKLDISNEVFQTLDFRKKHIIGIEGTYKMWPSYSTPSGEFNSKGIIKKYGNKINPVIIDENSNTPIHNESVENTDKMVTLNRPSSDMV